MDKILNILNYLSNNFNTTTLAISTVFLAGLIIFLMSLKHYDINKKFQEKGYGYRIVFTNFVMFFMVVNILYFSYKLSSYFIKDMNIEIYRSSFFHMVLAMFILVLFNMQWNFVINTTIKESNKHDYILKSLFRILSFITSIYLSLIAPLLITFYTGFFYMSNLFLQVLFMKEVEESEIST